MSVKTITCPDCGLVLKVVRGVAKSTVLYDVSDWQRRCKRLDLNDPAWCQLQRDTMSPTKLD